MSEVNLPEGWCQTKLAEIAEWGSGGTPSRKEASYYEGDIPWVKTGDLGPRVLHNSNEFISEIAVKNSSAKYFPKGSVAIAMYGATIGKTSILGIDATTNQACGVGNPIEGLTFSEFLYYFLLNEKKNFIAKGKGGAQPNISQTLIKEHGIALPPLAEQKVIADKLDTLLAQVETTKARLERIPKILKTFRQSVLAAAVSGKLTEEWRLTNSLEFKWDERLLSDVASYIVDCPHSTPKWSESGKYCVRTTAFNPFYLDMSDQGYVNDEVFDYRIKRLKPEPHDILYSREGTVGIACQIPEGVELCLGQRMVLIRAGEGINPKFLTSVLNSDLILTIVRQLTIGSTAPRVNMKDIKSYSIPVPSVKEQAQIVRRVEELFAFADRIEQKANAALERVNNLTQSILAKAFRGELSTDWRAENPELISGENSAEALLAKVKAEREAISGKKKPMKKAAPRKKA